MQIEFSVHANDARRWLLLLRTRLEAEGHGVRFRILGTKGGPGSSLSIPERLETALFGRGRSLWEAIDAGDLAPLAAGEIADLLIALSADDGGRHDLQLFLDGEPGIAQAHSALLAAFVPFVEIRNSAGSIIASGLPAVEEPDILVRALDHYYARCVTLLLSAITSERRSSDRVEAPRARARRPAEPALFVLKTIGLRILNRIDRRRKIRSQHWRVGIRKRDTAMSFDKDVLIEGFTWLDDDGLRYYADPILFEHDGRTMLFVEEYPYATRRGIISCTELDVDGVPLHTPVPVLESDTHFSYPFVFRHAGEIYMLPENAASDRLMLYRATDFPHGWVVERDLLPGNCLHDATMFEENGTFWLMGTTQEEGGSSWDCLSLFQSSSPFGPFRAAGPNPALIDARYARPAGPVLVVNGAKIRPVQSCLGGYGRFVRFLAVESLSVEGIVQHECGRLLAPLGSGIAGVHTYSASSRFEAIDACGELPTS